MVMRGGTLVGVEKGRYHTIKRPLSSPCLIAEEGVAKLFVNTITLMIDLIVNFAQLLLHVFV